MNVSKAWRTPGDIDAIYYFAIRAQKFCPLIEGTINNDNLDLGRDNSRGMVFDLEHPVERKIKQLGFPIKFGESPFEVRLQPPMWSEHTEEILTALGYSLEEIKRLREENVI